MGKNISKSIIKSLNGTYSQKRLDHTKQSATDAFKTASKRAIQKTAETTGDLVCNKIANKITSVPENSQQIIQKQLQMRVIKKYQKKDMYLPKIIDDLRLI